MEQQFTLLQLVKSVRNHIQKIDKTFWITAEINQVSKRGHYYLNLIQNDEGELVASCKASIWKGMVPWIESKLGEELDYFLIEGQKVLVRVEVTFHEVYGLSLVIHDVDPNYTLGELEARKLALLNYIQAKELDLLQKAKTLPPVLQNIAVISSEDSAGYRDFIHELEHNPYGYTFSIELFNTRVQGDGGEKDIVQALKKASKKPFDALFVLRGGGSRLDLELFDRESVALGIAHHPLPVITGIGHQQDFSVADVVSCIHCKTPTALAGYVISHNQAFEEQLDSNLERIKELARDRIQSERFALDRYVQSLDFGVKKVLSSKDTELKLIESQLSNSVSKVLLTVNAELRELEVRLKAANPLYQMKRGFVLVMQNGELVKKIDSLDPKSDFELAQGSTKVRASLNAKD